MAAAAMPTPRGMTLLGSFHAQRVMRPTPRTKITHVKFTIMYKEYTAPM